MKHSLGKILFLMIFGVLSLSASTYTWEANAKKSRLFMNEAVEIEYICQFNDEAYQYVIEFVPPKKGDGYRLYRLSETERMINGKRINRYRFVLFFEKSGTEVLDFNALMRRTSKASIEDTVLGRDNVEDFSFTDTKVNLPLLHFDIRAHQEKLTGKFSLEVHMEKTSVNAYESIPLTIKVEGTGNFDEFIPFELEIEGVDLFKEVPQKTLELMSQGYKGTWIERYALIPQHNFELPVFTLRYFDLVAEREIILHSRAIKVIVAEENASEMLLDKEEESAVEWNGSTLYYLLTLITGILIGRYVHIKPSVTPEEGTLYVQLQACRDPKRFVTLLVLLNDPELNGVINELDQQVKEGASVNLQKYKNALKSKQTVTLIQKIKSIKVKVLNRLVKKDS